MLIRSISGVRGLTGSHLNHPVSKKYAKALHSFLDDGVIMCGRDSRPSGEMIQNVMMDELVRLGRTVIDCGIVPTPTCLLYTSPSPRDSNLSRMPSSA